MFTNMIYRFIIVNKLCLKYLLRSTVDLSAPPLVSLTTQTHQAVLSEAKKDECYENDYSPHIIYNSINIISLTIYCSKVGFRFTELSKTGDKTRKMPKTKPGQVLS